MNRFGIQVELRHVPSLDPDYIPLMRFNRAFLAGAKKPVGIAVERSNGQMAACRTFIHGTPEMKEADCYYIERLVKTILWLQGLRQRRRGHLQLPEIRVRTRRTAGIRLGLHGQCV